MIILANATTIEIPVLPPELILPAFITFLLWSLWSTSRTRNRAETIQQDAQKLVHAEFEKKQKRIDDLEAKQSAADLTQHKLVTDNTALTQRVCDQDGQIATQKQYYETMVSAQKNALGLATERIEGLVTERESMAETVKQMDSQLSLALSRIDDLEKQIRKTSADMENFAFLLDEERKLRAKAEKAYADLQAEIEVRISSAVDDATKPLLSEISRKDAVIDELRSKIVQKTTKTGENGPETVQNLTDSI